MPVTEVFESWGGWSLRLKGLPDDTVPSEVWRALDPDVNGFGHVIITPTRVDPAAVGDTGMLAISRYTGMYRGGGSRSEISGIGLVGWLEDEDGKGDINLLPKTGGSGSFADWVADALPDGGAITAGTTDAIAGTFTQSFRYVTPLYILRQVMDFFGGVFRVNPDGTLDAGEESDLFATTPEVLLTWQGSGPDAQVDGIRASGIDLSRDLEDWASELYLFAEGEGEAVNVASSSLPFANPYKDLHGNAVVRGKAENAPDVPAAAAAGIVAARHGAIDETRKAYTLSTDEWGVTQKTRQTKRLEPGDYIYVYDPRPDAKLKDETNQVYFQGQLVMPVAMRLAAITWPVQEGMGVYFRYYDDTTPVYVDLSEHVEYETGATTLDVGAAPRTLTGGGRTAAEIQGRLATQISDYVDFASSYEAANLALSGSFQTSETLSYAPPSGWNSYRVQVEVFVVAAGLTSGDALQLAVQQGASVGTIFDDNAASAARTLLAYAEWTDLTGTTDFLARVRNNTAARGTVYTTGVRVTAVRIS